MNLFGIQPLADPPELYASNRDAVITTVLYTPPVEFNNPTPVITKTNETTTQGAPQTVNVSGGDGNIYANGGKVVNGVYVPNKPNGAAGEGGYALSSLPKTFDEMPLGLWFTLLGAGMAAVIFLIVAWRRRDARDEHGQR